MDHLNQSHSSEFNLHQELLELSREKSIDEGETTKSFECIISSVIRALSVSRAGIWFYNKSRDSIICQHLQDNSTGIQPAGLELWKKDFPNYFSYLNEERTLAANDALTNPSTKEFSEVYLKPLKIFSMLDAPIRVNGVMIGVLCCEQVGDYREWTPLEESFVGNICDIISRAIQARERADALKKLEEVNQKLERMVESKVAQLEEERSRSLFSSKMATLGEMASSMAHEINTPLAIIVASTSYYRRLKQLNKLDPAIIDETMEEVEKTALRIGKIIQGLRHFARDPSTDSFDEINLSDVVSDTLALCSTKYMIHGVKISSDIPDVLKIKCQNVSLSQAFLNLLSNSFDSVKDVDDKWINIEAIHEGDTIKLRFTDSGKAIPEDIREKIFIPFFTTKPIGQGTGLGLSVVKGIIESHGGKIDLDTTSPYTSFVITFPKI